MLPLEKSKLRRIYLDLDTLTMLESCLQQWTMGGHGGMSSKNTLLGAYPNDVAFLSNSYLSCYVLANKLDSTIMFTLQSRQLMSTKCRITIGSMIILSIAVVWFLLLLLFVCIGHDNVCFFAGQFKHKLPKISNLSNTFEGHNEDRESDGDDCDESREMEAE